MTAASRVKDWASCNWRFRNFWGLRIKLTHSTALENGSLSMCMGHEDDNQTDWACRHLKKRWKCMHVWSLIWNRDAIVALVGRISQASFHRKCLWQVLILAFQRVFQLVDVRGPVELNLCSWTVRFTDLTQRMPLLLWNPKWLVLLLCWREMNLQKVINGLWIKQRYSTLPRSHWNVFEVIRSDTWCMLGGIGEGAVGVKFGMVGIQEESQIYAWLHEWHTM